MLIITFKFKVSIINVSVIDVSSYLPMSRTELSIGGTMVVRLSGFLRFPQVWDNHKDQLQLCSRFATTNLIMTSPYMYQPVSKKCYTNFFLICSSNL